MTSPGERGCRYRDLFRRLTRAGEGAFIPFVVLGDPDPDESLRNILTLIASGADALELGLPFSDPVADGPVVQAAGTRALSAGVKLGDCWRILRAVRNASPGIPVGLLAYANLVLSRGPGGFQREAVEAGADSLLIPDLPVDEAPEVHETTRSEGLAPVLIAPTNVDDRRLERIARESEGYVYVTPRAGVTGERTRRLGGAAALISRLNEAESAPPVIGFGISGPEQVLEAIRSGAAGVISGSAIIRIASDDAADPGTRAAGLARFTQEMKQATRTPPAVE